MHPRRRALGETLSRRSRRLRPGAAHGEDLFKTARVRGDHRLGECADANWTQIALDPQTVNDTLGVLLKYQDDIERIQGSTAKKLVDEIRREVAGA